MAYTTPQTYYNRFDITKNYKKLLFLAGQGLQAAELNELQEFIRADLAQIASYLVKNGTILSGGGISALTASSISLSSANILADGHAVNVPAATLTITASGIELVGMAYKAVMITNLDDPTLVEQDPASPNVGQPGSYREQVIGRWCLSTQLTSDESFFPIITLNNGQVVSTSNATTNTDAFSNLLNAYDRETRGSAVLYGMNVAYGYIDASSQAVVCTVASGKCRVLGQPVIIPYQQNAVLSPISDLRSALGEPMTYTGSQNYPLRYNIVNNIIRAQGTKQVSGQSVTHGAFAGAIDALPNTPVLQILTVNQGATTYTQGTDFKQTGDSIDWSLTSNPSQTKQPAPGSTYTVTYNYIAVFYPVVSSDGLSVVMDSSNVLVNNTTLYVDYQYYLRRIDRISIDSTGTFIISKGTPGYTTYYATPRLPDSLSLATVELIYGFPPKVTVTQDTTANVTVSDLNTFKKQIGDLQYNVSLLSLAQNANAQAPTSTKRSTFVDNVANTAQQDAGQTNTAIIFDDKSNPGYTQSLGLASNLTVKATTAQWFNLAYTEANFIVQQVRSSSRAINPYATPLPAGQTVVTLSPNLNVKPPIKYGNEIWWWWHGDFLPYSTVVVAACSGFAPNETVNIVLGQSGKAYAIIPPGGFENSGGSIQTITLPPAVTGSGVTDASGVVNINLTIPALTPSGIYLTTATGVTSKASAQNTFTVMTTPNRLNGDYTVNDYIKWNGPGTVPYGYDPIAETFQPQTSVDLTSIDLYVTEIPGDALNVRITGAQYGIPDTSTTYGQGSIPQNQIKLGYNKVTFSVPIRVTQGSNYAITVLTSTVKGAVATAKLGLTNPDTNKMVTQQAYDGVLQLSANYQTWTPVQDEDLTFVLRNAVYSTATTTVTLCTSTGNVNVTDWMVSGAVSVPDGTYLRMYLLDSNNIQYDITDNTPIFTPPLSGTVRLMAVMSSILASRSPKIPPGLELLGGTAVKPATYTSRAVSIPTGITTPFTTQVFVDVYNPTGSTVTVQVRLANGTYANCTYVNGVNIGNGWVTQSYSYGTISNITANLRIILDTTDATIRPKVQNLRMLLN